MVHQFCDIDLLTDGSAPKDHSMVFGSFEA